MIYVLKKRLKRKQDLQESIVEVSEFFIHLMNKHSGFFNGILKHRFVCFSFELFVNSNIKILQRS